MSHIYIFSPSSAVRDKAAFRRGLKRLKAQGHEVEVDEAALPGESPPALATRLAEAKAQAVARDATALLTACGLALRSFD